MNDTRSRPPLQNAMGSFWLQYLDSESSSCSPFFAGGDSHAFFAVLSQTMRKSISSVDQYLIDGCGRCPLVATPQCKVNDWRDELKRLRTIILACGLTEELKWGVPCYTFEKKNILTISALKDSCSVGFFKGALLADAEQILEKPGENTQGGRVLRFTADRQIVAMESLLKQYILEAIAVEKAGRKVDFKAKTELVIPDELQRKFEALPAVEAAFHALTPGRQRGYILYFSAAKQSRTRASRIEKCIPLILEGKGMHD